MKKIILLLLVMASFGAFSQETKGVAIDLCVDTSFHDPNYEYLNVNIHNIYINEIKLVLGFNYQNISNFYLLPITCLVNDTMNIRLSKYTFNKVDSNDDCRHNEDVYFSYLRPKDYTISLKKKGSFTCQIRIPKEQFLKAKIIQICLIVENDEKHKNENIYFNHVNEVKEIQYKCSSSKNIQSKEKVKIELTEDKTKSNSTRVYLNFKITNLTNKKIQLLADEGYKLVPEMIFGVYDTIVSDTLNFKLFHPKFQLNDVILYNHKNDLIFSATTISSNKHSIKKGESITIHLVTSRAEFNSIKCIKMNWFDSFAKGGNDEFEKRVLYFPTNLIK